MWEVPIAIAEKIKARCEMDLSEGAARVARSFLAGEAMSEGIQSEWSICESFARGRMKLPNSSTTSYLFHVESIFKCSGKDPTTTCCIVESQKKYNRKQLRGSRRTPFLR